MESIGTLAGGIAHDLNNVLAPIMMSIDILKDVMNDAETKNILETIEISARQGADIVRQVLSFARGVEGERVEIQPIHLLRDLEHIIKSTFPRDILLRVITPGDPWTIMADPTQIHQVLLNLSVNARDAMPNGGTLTITTGRRLVLAPEQENGHTLKPGRYVTLEVTDTGTGIPPEIQARIFEPFFTTRKSAGGTGLGLSTVQGIIRQSGGTLSLRTEAGRGTSFTITLPRYDALPAPMPQPAPLAVSGSRCVLLVDDEAPIRLLAARALTKAGWRVLQAPSAEDALEMDTACIDQVISDVSMPGMDGPTLVRTLRTRHPGLKALLISGYADAAQRQALLAERVKFLAKPFAMADLVRQVEESTSF
jgi:CheY-like chemotaxis protein